MEFTVHIDCGNSAFQDAPATEIARILRTIANRVEAGDLDGRVRDYNGNTCGHFEAKQL